MQGAHVRGHSLTGFGQACGYPEAPLQDNAPGKTGISKAGMHEYFLQVAHSVSCVWARVGRSVTKRGRGCTKLACLQSLNPVLVLTRPQGSWCVGASKAVPASATCAPTQAPWLRITLVLVCG